MRLSIASLIVCAAGALSPVVFAADPWADHVVFYDPGAGAAPYTDPLTALGSPERFTGEGVFPAAVTPFNTPWGTDEIVSIGQGGSLTLSFDEPITNNPLNPFGLDLLLFGNAAFNDANYPSGIVDGFYGQSIGGIVELSADGNTWVTATGIEPDWLFPTLGYSDLTDPYATDPGSVLTDFTLPVNPALNFQGAAFAQIVAGYNGSGGGRGIDIGAYGLSAVSFVRFTNPSPVPFQIDALATVTPAPSPGLTPLLVLPLLARARRGRSD